MDYVIREFKTKIKHSLLLQKAKSFGFTPSDVRNMLRFYTEVGAIIYFDSEKNLIGIANKGRALKINNILESTIDRNYRMQYLMLPPNMETREFEAKMTKYFAGRD